MPTVLPYLASNKNVETLFSKIAAARIPPKFTHEFLTQTIGLKGANDRGLIPMLRTLGYLDQSSTPTPQYGQLKNSATAKISLAAAIRSAYKPLFDSDENADKLTSEKLKGLVAQVAGADEGMTARIAATFNALAKLADFSAKPNEPDDDDADDEGDEQAQGVKKKLSKGLRPEFHYNIQIHLPANASEDVYLNIFNALRKVFQ
jgi:hypothetical protein